MQMSGEFLFHGPIEAVWTLLNDPKVLKLAIPGCERLTLVGPDRYEAEVTVGLAVVKGRYNGTVAVTDLAPPGAMTLIIDMKGSTGVVHVAGRLSLTPVLEATRLNYLWDVQIGGPIAMAGQRILGGAARWLIGEFFAAADQELVRRLKEAAASPVAVPPSGKGDKD